MSENQIDWPGYLREFHSATPGSTEALLSRAVAGDHTPYRWLVRAVSGEARRVLDLACGNGPVARELYGRWVVGVDSNAIQLDGAPGPKVQADALHLPFANEAFDVVTCSMGLMVLQPLPDVLAEAARVLRRGGVLAATIPAVRPLRRGDLRTLTGLTTRLRSRPQFPAGGEITGLKEQLREAGFIVMESQRERYVYTVRSIDDARRMVGALYLPGTSQKRREQTAAWMAQRAHDRDGLEIAIPIRRITAMRTTLALG
ncbi:class I SAM-dependent methyltransferase [Kribbella italica]|uniref:Ubiquinone/menaquinone biosynthesis C-methylase UbiE n=1 Tax=Kribbella italica TaxID=1540520 RepID=A0A7W9JAH7_9ACTN|nr:class I SAM-dependent methyltransferase [Kribbella italica]MBB5837883.1 ubiquinone/menaquinone biosynthesis C-methylase UbiE [Kribbella italica]